MKLPVRPFPWPASHRCRRRADSPFGAMVRAAVLAEIGNAAFFAAVIAGAVTLASWAD